MPTRGPGSGPPADHDETGLMVALSNPLRGLLLAGDERFPEHEIYPLDSFPAVAALLREGRPYLNPDDVSSVALSAHHRYHSHAAVPIVVEGERWGELWV